MMCIYCINSAESGNQYVGSTICFAKRKRGHLCDLRKGRHHSFLLQRAFNKHGESNFNWSILEVLSPVSTKEDIEAAELKWMLQLKPRYNASHSVNRHALGKKLGPMPEARKESIRKANTGKTHSAETRLKISQARTGLKLNLSDEARESLRDRGRKVGLLKPTQETIRKTSLTNTGRKASIESVRKRAEMPRGRPWTEQNRQAHLTGNKAGAPTGKPWSEARRQAYLTKKHSDEQVCNTK